MRSRDGVATTHFASLLLRAAALYRQPFVVTLPLTHQTFHHVGVNHFAPFRIETQPRLSSSRL